MNSSLLSFSSERCSPVHLRSAVPPVFGKIATRTCLLLAFAIGLSVGLPAHAGQVNIPAPADSGNLYADTVVVLPNGNIVVVDVTYGPAGDENAGAVYLLDGATLAIISRLTGSVADDAVGGDGITVLSNGNFVVTSSSWNGLRGAVTWGSKTTGFIGGGTVATVFSFD